VYAYFTSDLRYAGRVEHDALAGTTERHWIALARPTVPAVAVDSDSAGANGAIFELAEGLPNHVQLQAMTDVLTRGRAAWAYWPAEQAVEVVDPERLASWRRHQQYIPWLRRVGSRANRVRDVWVRLPGGLRWIYRGEFPVRRSDLASRLDMLIAKSQPVQLRAFTPARTVAVYLRTDYWLEEWLPSDPETIRQLASGVDHLVGLTPLKADASCDGRCRTVRLDTPRFTAGQDAIVKAPEHYLPIVKAACLATAPTFIYERLCLGQSAGAEISQVLQIPYILEYPGSEVVTTEALQGETPLYPELYARTEELALRQASFVVVPSETVKDGLVGRGIDRDRLLVADRSRPIAATLSAAAGAKAPATRPRNATGDEYKERVQDQWNENPVGSHYARKSQPHTLEWFLEVERHRYDVYAPWMRDVMEFALHANHDVLEIGGGIGTDLAQFAKHGARVTDVDLAVGHLQLAEENFRVRGLNGRFVHHDAEQLPFDAASFDLVYSNGVLHHTPNTSTVVREIHRVLRPGGHAIVMLYAENSLHYWRKLVWQLGIKEGLLQRASMGEIMSRTVERSANEARPLVKVYTPQRARLLFAQFARVEILQRQMETYELPAPLRWSLGAIERRFGWNLIVKAEKAR